MTRRRYELTDKEWSIIEPLLPNKPRGVPRVDDRRVLNGILWRFRTGSPWAEVPERYGPSRRCQPFIRFTRWRRISAAKSGPNLFHHKRTVSWQTSIPRSNRRSSTLRRLSGNRTYMSTARRMISGEE